VTLDVFRNFWRVLQNWPKHLKIYLQENCPVCWGTQLSCRLTFQILSGKDEKLAQMIVSPIHGHKLAFKVGKLLLQNLLRKTPYGICESYRWYWDLQLSYSKFCALLYKFLELFNFKQWTNKILGPGAARRACASASLGVRATRSLRPRRPRPPRP
jgi:hypothetical protein